MCSASGSILIYIEILTERKTYIMEQKPTRTFRIGPIRPPSEANSLLLQVTSGCTWNKCAFCELYKNSQFKAYSVDSIKKDIDDMVWHQEMVLEGKRPVGLSPEEQNCYYMIENWMAHGGKNVFLQDGNTIALSAERLLEVLEYLREKLPTIERITSYGRAETLSKVSADQFKSLKIAGLDRIHSGFETGSDEVLRLIEKGTTSEQQIAAGKNIKAGGIELSVYFMPGVGGKNLTIENALGTARVVSEINPDFVRIRTAAVKEGTGLWQKYLQGTYQLCSDNDKVKEIKILIENTLDCTGIIASDHIINLLQDVHGRLDVDRNQLIGTIDAYLGMSVLEQRRFQLARRAGLVSSLSHMKQISSQQMNQIDAICSENIDEKQWDFKMNDFIGNYI